MKTLLSDNYSHIYAFVEKGLDLPVPLVERIFYIGSSRKFHIRLIDHVKKMYGDYTYTTTQEVYKYVKDSLRKNNNSVDVYIIDHVPHDLRLTYERIYYDILISKCSTIVKNTNKPIPEQFEMLSDENVLGKCQSIFNEFIQRKVFTTEETSLNALKFNLTNCHLKNASDDDKIKITNLQKMNRTLTIKNKQLTETNNSMSINMCELNNNVNLLTSLNKYLQQNIIDISESVKHDFTDCPDQTKYKTVILTQSTNDYENDKIKQEKNALEQIVISLRIKNENDKDQYESNIKQLEYTQLESTQLESTQLESTQLESTQIC